MHFKKYIYKINFCPSLHLLIDKKGYKMSGRVCLTNIRAQQTAADVESLQVMIVDDDVLQHITALTHVCARETQQLQPTIAC